MEKHLDNKIIKIWACSFFITIISVLPYLTSKIYSIDDYHLLNTYDLNWKTLGYNFYSTGRFVEGLIAEILFRFNMQPVNKPVGAIFFVFSVVSIGIYIAGYLNIQREDFKILFTLLVSLNPFYTELYYYGTITIYCGFAVVFLMLGLFFSNQYLENKRIINLILSIICYICSLGTYQIFYPMVGFSILIKGIIELKAKDKEKKWMEWGTTLGLYILGFICFYVILKLMFFVKPPMLVYDGVDIVQFVKDLFSKDYWNIIYQKISLFLLNDNIFFSSLTLKIVLILMLLAFIKSVIRKEKRYLEMICSSIFIFIGLYLVFGLGITRPTSISARTLASFGVYEAGLFIVLLQFVKERKVKSKYLVVLFSAIIFINAAIVGKNALNTMRLNEIELNMANRIVARMETFEEFTAGATVAIVGVPETGKIGLTGMGDYNIPASVSFSKVFMFNEATGYSFSMPTNEQYVQATDYMSKMDTWPGTNSVIYKDGMFIVRLYY